MNRGGAGWGKAKMVADDLTPAGRWKRRQSRNAPKTVAEQEEVSRQILTDLLPATTAIIRKQRVQKEAR